MSDLISHYSNDLKLKNHDGVNHQIVSPNQERNTIIDSGDDSLNMFESEFDKECDEDYALETSDDLERYFMECNEDSKNKDFDILP